MSPDSANTGAASKDEKPNEQAALAEFNNVAKRLLCMGLKQSQLVGALRSVVLEASKALPPVRVLYSYTHGGFGYCQEFKDFRRVGSSVPGGAESYAAPPALVPSLATLCAASKVEPYLRDRITDVPVVQAYGQHLFGLHPFVGRLVYAYLAGFGAAMSGAALRGAAAYRNTYRTLAITRKRQQQLEEHKDAPDGAQADWSGLKWNLQYGAEVCFYTAGTIRKEQGRDFDISFALFTQQAREEMRACLATAYEAHTAAHDKARQELSSALLGVLSGDQALVEEVLTSLFKELPGKQGFVRQGDADGNDVSFSKAIEVYGEQHWAIWLYQCIFETTPMESLLKCPAVLDKLLSGGMTDVQLLAECYEQLGLAAAGGSTQLVIHEVPQLAEWHISEYDGAESVVLV